MATWTGLHFSSCCDTKYLEQPRGRRFGLVSRVKYREFGVLVTTAHVGAQPYEEVRSDGHPIVFITGRDIVEALSRRGLRTVADVRAHLEATYPLDAVTRAPN
jgi:hypothetical protein